jgi:4'-phosphopantetheinyl transferase
MARIKIYIQYLADITWNNAATCGFSINNGVDVWRIGINSSLSQLNNFLAVMPPDEIARANRYFYTKDKHRFIISRGAVRNILGKYLGLPAASIEFETGGNKKPHIKNTNNINVHYNISHSGDWILLAISNSPIGADTEQVIQGYSYKDVLPGNFSEAETEYINQTSPVERFFTLWTRKEALTKATGKGLDDDLKLIPALDGTHFVESKTISSDDDWLISTFQLAENYSASVACSSKVDVISFRDVDFTNII